MKLPNSRIARVLTLLLVLQGGAYYAAAFRTEKTPLVPPLSVFPTSLNDWYMTAEVPPDPQVESVLKADDQLDRRYVNRATGGAVSFFVAFFKTQRYGQAPHSPKNCLPGAGWEPVVDSTLPIRIAQPSRRIEVHKYVVQMGDRQDVALYWYQSHNRVIASEYWAKIWLVLDSIRYRRSDTALVRVIVPALDHDIDTATRTGTAFIQAAFNDVQRWSPAGN